MNRKEGGMKNKKIGNKVCIYWQCSQLHRIATTMHWIQWKKQGKRQNRYPFFINLTGVCCTKDIQARQHIKNSLGEYESLQVLHRSLCCYREHATYWFIKCISKFMINFQRIRMKLWKSSLSFEPSTYSLSMHSLCLLFLGASSLSPTLKPPFFLQFVSSNPLSLTYSTFLFCFPLTSSVFSLTPSVFSF